MRIAKASGFSLIEVTLAIGVAAFCLVVVFGLLPVAQQSQQTASEQTAAANLISEVVSDLRAAERPNPPTPSISPHFGLTVGAAAALSETLYFRDGADVIGPPGTLAASANPRPRYRVTIFFNAPTGGREALTGRILVTWPALADPQPDTAPSKYSGSLESFIAIDRN